MNYNEAKKKAEDESEKASHDDFMENGFPRVVVVEHLDGSIMRFVSAKCERHDGRGECEIWFTICTEHHGSFVYHWEDVKSIKCETLVWKKVV